MQEFRNLSPKLAGASLTPRQIDVLGLVANRLTIKQISCRLGISDSAVNQHIKAIKAALGVNSLAEMAEIHRALQAGLSEPACRNVASRNYGLPEAAELRHLDEPNDAEQVVSFHDSLSHRLVAPWEETAEPSVVPGVLKGANAKVNRVAAIMVIAIGMAILILLGLGVAQGITAALESERASSVQSI